jgi:hypothetical protein
MLPAFKETIALVFLLVNTFAGNLRNSLEKRQAAICRFLKGCMQI